MFVTRLLLRCFILREGDAPAPQDDAQHGCACKSWKLHDLDHMARIPQSRRASFDLGPWVVSQFSS